MHPIRKAATIAAAGLLTAATATAAPAAARPAELARAAAKTCRQAPYSDRLQAPHNAAGVVFLRKGDYWKLWDNKRDGWATTVEYNYAGVGDDWKRASRVDDGGQNIRKHNVSERFRYICFRLYSPSYGYTHAVRYRT
jgi:hypothetical protein